MQFRGAYQSQLRSNIREDHSRSSHVFHYDQFLRESHIDYCINGGDTSAV
jgi:hypothetical protein